MKFFRTYLLVVFLSIPFLGRSQDVAITSIVSPVSGCNIGLDTITVTLFNASPFPVGGTFTMQYSVNGGAPVSQSFSTALNASQSVNFSFSSLYNFNTDATFLVCATVIFIGDINNANNTSCANVISDTSVIGGSISSSVSIVCSGSNSGVLTLTGNNNPITQWEYSNNGGNPPWFPVVPTNNSTTNNFTNLIDQTYYRVLIEGGFCPDDYSQSFVVNVDLPSNAGSISGSTTFCSSVNAGQLDAIGVVGTILDWETSTTGTFPGTSTGNNSDSLLYSNLTQTTYYQITAQNGVCPPATSAIGLITVLPPSDGGDIIGDGIFCMDGNSGILTLTAYGGDSLYWMYSTDGGVNWNTISNLTDQQPFTNITVNTVYAAVVQFTGCAADTSSFAFIDIVPNPIADAGVDDTILIYDNTILNASGSTFYDWTPANSLDDPNISNPIASPIITTVYTVTVTDANGCTDTDQVIIVVIDTTTVIPTTLTVNNYVTLNGDGLNDVWKITGITSFNQTEVTVFNNQGQIVFTQTGYQNDWGGTYEGKELPDGSYYYVVKVDELDFIEKGILTIISDQ